MQKRIIPQTILFLATLFIFIDLPGQNVGIGTNEPLEKLQVNGNLLIQQPYTSTTLAPTDAQIKTMVNGSTITFDFTDFIGRIYDPGGPAGNYLDNLSGTAIMVANGGAQGIEIAIEDMDLNTGDSLIIKDDYNVTIFNAGNGHSITGKYVFNTSGLNILFKSDSDGHTGRGFSLLFKRLSTLSNESASNSGFGNALYFDAVKGILRAGSLSAAPKGNLSTAIGDNTTASGIGSTATGSNTTASGIVSTALGGYTEASSNYSTAMGFFTRASGENSTAMGFSTKASNENSTAIGYITAASGSSSTAMGSNTTASGNLSTAVGDNTIASGIGSTAMGGYTKAGGNYSTALGWNTKASGDGSTAIGIGTTASGINSTAMGAGTTASGNNSTAMGNYVSTSNRTGAFIVGDLSTTTILGSNLDNSFRARFANGYRLYTNSSTSIGAVLAAGDNSWSTISDVRRKENFEPVNGEDFLEKISLFKLASWNYKGQKSSAYRHYGPMAQDFYEAFGKDKYGAIGNDTTINQADFNAVNLVAIQALIKRAEKLNEENSALKQQVSAMQKKLDEIDNILVKRMQQLEELEVKPKVPYSGVSK